MGHDGEGEMIHDMMDIEEADEEEGDGSLSKTRKKHLNSEFNEMLNDSSDDDRHKYNDNLRE